MPSKSVARDQSDNTGFSAEQFNTHGEAVRATADVQRLTQRDVALAEQQFGNKRGADQYNSMTYGQTDELLC